MYRNLKNQGFMYTHSVEGVCAIGHEVDTKSDPSVQFMTPLSEVYRWFCAALCAEIDLSLNVADIAKNSDSLLLSPPNINHTFIMRFIHTHTHIHTYIYK